jgi:hypothetical protein
MATFDGPNKIITLDDPAISPTQSVPDIYSEWKIWTKVSDNLKWLPAFDLSVGGNDTNPPEKLDGYYFVRNDYGWRVKPYEADGVTTLAGNLFAFDTGTGLFLTTTGAFTAMIIGSVSSKALAIETGVSGLTASEALQLNEMHGQVLRSVYINTEAVAAGNGYQQSPYNNFTTAVDFAEANGIKNLVLVADATADRQLKNFIFHGIGDPTLDVNGQDVGKSEFHDMHLTGDINPISEIYCHNVELENGLTGLNGDFFNCGFAGTITLAGNANVTMIDCYSTIGGLSRPTVNINGGGSSNVSIRSYRGGLNIGGVDTAGDEVTVSLSEGKLTLLNTNTAGVISVRGVSQFTDESAGSAIDTEGLLDTVKQGLLVKLLMNRMETDPTTGIMTIYDDDDVTVLLQGNIYEDVLASKIYQGRGMERRDRLS